MFLFEEWSDIYLTYEMQFDALAARRRSAEKICSEQTFVSAHTFVTNMPVRLLNKVFIWYYCICILFRQRSIYNLMFIGIICSFFLSRNTFTNF